MGETYSYEPPRLEVWLTQMIGSTLLRPYYAGIVKGFRLRQGERVLDYCSGCGHIAKRIAAQVGKGNLTYADVSEEWLAQASKKLGKYDAQGIKLSGFDGPIGGGGYDKIVVHLVIHDFPAKHRAAILRQLVGNLKPGGALKIREPLSGAHGLRLHELVNALEEAGPVTLRYERGASRFIGEYVDVECVKNESLPCL